MDIPLKPSLDSGRLNLEGRNVSLSLPQELHTSTPAISGRRVINMENLVFSVAIGKHALQL